VLTISVLGPIEITHGDRTVGVPGGKTSELLVRLALEAGRPVRTDRLLDDLWGSDAGARRNTLQSKIVKLRRALGDAAAVAGVEGGYVLSVDPSAIDALVVPQRLSAAAALVEQGDDAAVVELCAVTRRLFRGELLVGAGGGEWVAPHRSRLLAAQMQLVETECGARLRLGQVGQAAADLDGAVLSFPYAESLWVLLITALYRTGRQSDALAAYQRVRSLLADDLGLEPGPSLRQVETQVLMHDQSLDAAHAGTSPAGDLPVGNLPTMRSHLVGRATQMSVVRELVVAEPLVELVGPGGIGKTALAIAVGHRISVAGGVWLARLESTSTPGEVADSVVAALQVTGGVSSLFERLKAADTTLILDNCEHVLDPVADLVQRMLDEAPRTRILCTTQAALGIDGEVVVELEPLSIDDAVELFKRRASAQRSSTGDDAGVRDVCRSLDGLPLAIELAAARTKTLSVAEIARRLDDRFELLSDPTSRRPERRRALRATIGWSYDLLFPDDQRGLWALATFAGGATLLAIECLLLALDVPPRTAMDVVGRLAGRSLVIVDTDVTGSRYRLLDSIRAFALEAMHEAGADAMAHAAHAAWLAQLAATSTDGTRSRDQARHLAVARAERTNIDAALAWCVRHDPVQGVAIAIGFGWAWVVLGDSRGAQRILIALDAAGDATPPAERAVGLLLAGWLEASTGDLATARRHVEEASAIADAIDDDELRARSAYYLAYVVSHHGDFEQGLALTENSRALYAGLDRPWDVVANALFATRAAISAGDEQRAVEAADHATHALRAVGDPWMHVRFEAMLGELARLQHRFDDAVEHIGRAAATSLELGFMQTEAYQVSSLGRAQCQAGRYELGAATLRSAIAKAEATGDVRMVALARVHLGRVMRALGDTTHAREALERAAAWHRSAGGGEQAVLGDCLLAALDARDGRADAGLQLQVILDRAVADDNAAAEVFALDALALLAAQSGDHAAARAMSARADARMPTATHFITQLDRVDAVDPTASDRNSEEFENQQM
jgi:predicted ATPase/DNA-binding SARP family transcriptional activator